MTLSASMTFAEFNSVRMPQLLRDHGQDAAKAAASLAPLAIVVNDVAYTYSSDGATFTVAAGETDARCVVGLDEDAWQDLISERLTTFGLLYTNRVSLLRGTLDDLTAWEPAFRSLFVGRPVFDPHQSLLAADGEPVDLHRAFTLDDSGEELSSYLRLTGYAVVRNVFDPDEVEALRVEADRLAAMARPGDRRSWWAERGEEQLLCRLTYTGQRSGVIEALHADERIRRLLAATAEDLRPVSDRMDGEQIVIKVPGTDGGLADLPWHVDCGLGMHPSICPSALIGIQLEAANADTGQLHFLAGSWRGTCAQSLPLDDPKLPVVSVDTAPGDCTIHFSDVLHAAPSPSGPSGRRTLYLQYYPETTFDVIPEGKGTNDVLVGHADGVVRSVEELPSS